MIISGLLSRIFFVGTLCIFSVVLYFFGVERLPKGPSGGTQRSQFSAKVFLIINSVRKVLISDHNYQFLTVMHQPRS